MDPSSKIEESYTDVLVIGAGPAGVMCANALVHAGIDVRIVDKRPEELQSGQADGVQPRTLEILQSYGLFDTVFKEGNPVYRAAYYNPDGRGGITRTRLTPSVSAPDARYTFGVSNHQGAIEGVFVDSMKEKGTVVERSTVPVSLKMSDSPAELQDPQAYVNTVVLQRTNRDDQTEIVHAKFVVGADGAHSWIRKHLGIRTEGSVSNSVWGVVDIVPDTDLPDVRGMTYVQSEHGTMFLIPRERDGVRLYVEQPADSDVVDPTTGRADKGRSSPEKILQQVRKMMHPFRMEVKDGQIHWWTIYVVGQRVAEKYSVHDRVIITGDACHTHSPKAGQGMNAALGDSHNLAWKLAYVLRGWSGMSLLRTYESERRKYAQDLIAFDKVWSRMFIGKPGSVDGPGDRDHHSTDLMAMSKKFGGFITGIGICYGPSDIVNVQHKSLASGLNIGARMPPHVFLNAGDGAPVEIQDILPSDTRFKVLVFGGDVAVPEDAARLQAVADAMAKPDSFLHRFGQGHYNKIFDVSCFSKAKQENASHLLFPQFFRPHWSKVFLDDVDAHGRIGGNGYAKYGVDPSAGAVIIVRPDGYVGTIAPLDRLDDLTAYFGSFML